MVVLINLSTKSIFLDKNEILGFLEKVYAKNYEITTNAASDLITLETTKEPFGNVQQQLESKFHCSLADISICR